MIVVAAVATRTGLLLARLPTAPGDPFGPVERDPDAARDVACGLTEAERVCFPPEPEPFEPPAVGSTGSGGGAAFGNLLVFLLVVALAVAIGWLIVVIVRNRVAGDDEEDDVDLDVDLDEPVERQIDHERPPDTWRDAAAEHRAAGRYRDAIRCEYRALVGDLARAGYVDEIPGRTSGEERAQVSELAPTVAGEFDVAADLFDDAWFGLVAVDGADDGRFVAAARAVLGVVLAGAGGRADRGDS